MAADRKYACDVAVIGGGISGLVAAVRCAQGGLRVLVLERQSGERYPCNSRLSAGVWHICASDILDAPETLESKMLEATGGEADPALARVVAHDAARVVDWLKALGIRFMKGPYAYQRFVMAPPAVSPQGAAWEGCGPDVALQTLEEKLNELGGSVLRGHRATGLEMLPEGVGGLHGLTQSSEPFEVRAGKVIIADGGFQSDPGLVREWIAPDPDRLLARNSRASTGDGLRMAREAGGAASDLRGFYGHLLSRDAARNEALSPYPYLDYLATAGVVVDAAGRRIADEGRGGVFLANRVAARSDAGDHFVVTDQRIWEECGTFRITSPNPLLARLGATMYQADSIEAAAVLAGIDASGLAATVAAYNRALADGSTASLDPARSADKYKPWPLVVPPFHVFPVLPGITYTMGGIAIDAHARVVTSTGIPVGNLYAAGCASGGLEGGTRHGYVGGLVKSGVTGLRAAEHILDIPT
ncbi:FAD-dependent oxidoreductase [Pigmentiphaga sp. H8]|uniref:FAD-dependent oxidoreductase n=1 Tax=Pigmentiphaga sp. H8 TaxID=2488560 RepID=UPI000F5B6591|nr:FAD-dependent oxidoreductase [Pigmentiphaga sp. H8]AZG08263.1 FAD-dependent oxidoreductase [Pigmentiphaga sp. H8]